MVMKRDYPIRPIKTIPLEVCFRRRQGVKLGQYLIGQKLDVARIKYGNLNVNCKSYSFYLFQFLRLRINATI